MFNKDSHQKCHPALIGLFQSIAIAIYCGLISGFMWSMNDIMPNMGEMRVWGPALMLVLIVFSAAVTGILFFGYSAYLAFNKQPRRALTVVGYTFLFSLIIIVATFLIFAIIYV